MARASGRTSLRQPAYADDIDAITPCPAATAAAKTESAQFTDAADYPRRSRSSSPSSIDEPMSPTGLFERRRSSIKTLEEGTDGDPERLWKRMLALQQVYGCYKSARMSAALELGDTNWLMRKLERTCTARRRGIPADAETSFQGLPGPDERAHGIPAG